MKLIKYTLLCIMLPLLLSCGEPTKITYKVVDESGNPIQGVKITAVNATGGSYGMWKYTPHIKESVTDSNGIYIYKENVLGWGVSASFKKEGYYETSAAEIKIWDIRKYWTSQNNTPPVIVLLKKRVKPVPMYAKKTNPRFPKNAGKFGYDLVVGDFVKPYGSGDVSDFIFHIKSTTENRGSISLFDITFSNKSDGIQPFFVQYENAPRYELKSNTSAPITGYFKSLKTADGDWKDVFKRPEYSNNNVNRHWSQEINYYFRVRSQKNGKSMYGKIYGSFNPLLYSQSGLPNVEFTYFLNPDWTNNLEFEKNLLTFSSSTDSIDHSPNQLP